MSKRSPFEPVDGNQNGRKKKKYTRRVPFQKVTSFLDDTGHDFLTDKNPNAFIPFNSRTKTPRFSNLTGTAQPPEKRAPVPATKPSHTVQQPRKRDETLRRKRMKKELLKRKQEPVFQLEAIKEEKQDGFPKSNTTATTQELQVQGSPEGSDMDLDESSSDGESMTSDPSPTARKSPELSSPLVQAAQSGSESHKQKTSPELSSPLVQASATTRSPRSKPSSQETRGRPKQTKRTKTSPSLSPLLVATASAADRADNKRPPPQRSKQPKAPRKSESSRARTETQAQPKSPSPDNPKTTRGGRQDKPNGAKNSNKEQEYKTPNQQMGDRAPTSRWPRLQRNQTPDSQETITEPPSSKKDETPVVEAQIVVRGKRVSRRSSPLTKLPDLANYKPHDEKVFRAMMAKPEPASEEDDRSESPLGLVVRTPIAKNCDGSVEESVLTNDTFLDEHEAIRRQSASTGSERAKKHLLANHSGLFKEMQCAPKSPNVTEPRATAVKPPKTAARAQKQPGRLSGVCILTNAVSNTNAADCQTPTTNAVQQSVVGTLSNEGLSGDLSSKKSPDPPGVKRTGKNVAHMARDNRTDTTPLASSKAVRFHPAFNSFQAQKAQSSAVRFELGRTKELSSPNPRGDLLSIANKASVSRPDTAVETESDRRAAMKDQSPGRYSSGQSSLTTHSSYETEPEEPSEFSQSQGSTPYKPIDPVWANQKRLQGSMQQRFLPSPQNPPTALWTKEFAGRTITECGINAAPTFRLKGRLFKHIPLPPGWSVEISESKNQPYYHHPDFGTTFFCPVPLPSAGGNLQVEHALDVAASNSVPEHVRALPHARGGIMTPPSMFIKQSRSFSPTGPSKEGCNSMTKDMPTSPSPSGKQSPSLTSNSRSKEDLNLPSDDAPAWNELESSPTEGFIEMDLYESPGYEAPDSGDTGNVPDSGETVGISHQRHGSRSIPAFVDVVIYDSKSPFDEFKKNLRVQKAELDKLPIAQSPQEPFAPSPQKEEEELYSPVPAKTKGRPSACFSTPSSDEHSSNTMNSGSLDAWVEDNLADYQNTKSNCLTSATSKSTAQFIHESNGTVSSSGIKQLLSGASSVHVSKQKSKGTGTSTVKKAALDAPGEYSPVDDDDVFGTIDEDSPASASPISHDGSASKQLPSSILFENEPEDDDMISCIQDSPEQNFQQSSKMISSRMKPTIVPQKGSTTDSKKPVSVLLWGSEVLEPRDDGSYVSHGHISSTSSHSNRSVVSDRSLHPIMPICKLQNVNALPKSKACKKKQGPKVTAKKSKTPKRKRKKTASRARRLSFS